MPGPGLEEGSCIAQTSRPQTSLRGSRGLLRDSYAHAVCAAQACHGGLATAAGPAAAGPFSAGEQGAKWLFLSLDTRVTRLHPSPDLRAL